ncbi:MAG TPA: hypothetical protein VF526_07055 [Solirubrobacteraceae bacterium]|jgi:hypothetical protein
MPLIRTHAHRRHIVARRWFSKDHRDFQTLGHLTAWWSRRSRPGIRQAVLEQRTAAAHLPALSRIVAVRREDAVVYVEFQARCVTFDGRPLALARDAAGAALGATDASQAASLRAERRTWTVTLALN